MITCVNDLIGTYIDKSDKELLSAWFKVVKPIIESSGKGLEWFKNDFCCVESRGGVIIVSSIEKRWTSGKRELTLSDFKPTRTEYVKVEGSIFDLKAEFEAGELYTRLICSGEYRAVEEESALVDEYNDGNVYRKVEREVTWRDELLAAIRGGASIGEGSVRVGGADLTDEQFIEMCHKVHHLTK